MPDVQTRADSIRAYLTGAGSDGGAQTDPDAALGNYRSSTEAQIMGNTVTNPISNVTVDFVAGANGTGAGTLTATGSDTLAWQAPGSATQGPSVTIANGETKIVEDGDDSSAYLRVSRTSATALTGAATVTITDVLENLIGKDNWTSAEASAGDDEYRAAMLKNENSVNATSAKAYLATLGTQVTTDSAQLPASGAGTITTTGSFSDWPDSGFCHIANSGGVLQEIVYYTSRTATSLTVPAAGRGLLGTSASAGSATDTGDAVPGCRIAFEEPSSDAIQTIADEDTAPTGRTWNTGITLADGINLNSEGAAAGTIAAAGMAGLWIHTTAIAGHQSIASALNHIILSFDAV